MPELPEDIRDLADRHIKEALEKVTTDGKLDREKAIRYILEHMNEVRGDIKK